MLSTKLSDHKRGDRVKVPLYWCESKSNIASRWIHSAHKEARSCACLLNARLVAGWTVRSINLFLRIH